MLKLSKHLSIDPMKYYIIIRQILLMQSQYENKQPAVQPMEMTIDSCAQVTIKQQQHMTQFKMANTVVKLLFLVVSAIMGVVIITLLNKSLNDLPNEDISFIKNKDLKYLNKQTSNLKNSESHEPIRQHYHEPIKFKYETMGMRIPRTTFNFSIVQYNQIQQFQKEMEKVFKPYHDTDCELQRYGDRVDGGYLICSNFVNQTTALLNFGIEGRDYFGCQVSTAFNLTNYQYDCTNSIAPQCPTNSNKNIFDQACLGQKSEISNTKFYSLKDIIDMKNLTKKHVMMKIDVEGAEWPGLRTFPISYLDYVDQFIFEIHFNGGASLHPNFWGNLDIVRELGEKFVSVNFHVNNNGCAGGYRFGYFGSLAIQVTLVNKNLIRKKSNSRSYKLHPKNYINNQQLPDCQMKD